MKADRPIEAEEPWLFSLVYFLEATARDPNDLNLLPMIILCRFSHEVQDLQISCADTK